MRPLPEDHPPYFGNYIKLVEENEISEAFKKQSGVLKNFLNSIPEEKWNYRYAEGKWTIKELVQHCIDAERVFTYRAMCIARKETVSLPSFDENEYAANSDAGRRAPTSLIEEYLTLRQSTEQLFNSFTDEMLAQPGIANSNKITVLSLGYTLLGHFIHHKNVVEQRYGV